ncbi:MAG: PH domain-containing protein [Mycobacterium sp.]
MTESKPGPDWDAEFAPRKMPSIAYGVAAVIVVAGLTVAIVSQENSTGAFLRTADQFAMAGLAAALAGGVLLLTRPRLRAGAAGLAVRNVLGYRLIPWEQVIDVSFPPGKRWARVDLEHNEYIPVLAIQSLDQERAVAAMDTVRGLMSRYR